MSVLAVQRDEPDRARRRARAVTLRLDGDLWLRVTDEELLELGVDDGELVDAARRSALEEALQRTRARLFVVRSLAARAQSVAEIEAKLARRGIPPQIGAETVRLALGYGYLDDARLAGELARGHRDRGYGRRRAARSLAARLLPRDVAEQALAEAYDDVDETAAALAALGRRSFGEGDAGRRRAAAFLARRGFSSTTAWTAVRRREEGLS
jgi:regulatory protein